MRETYEIIQESVEQVVGYSTDCFDDYFDIEDGDDYFLRPQYQKYRPDDPYMGDTSLYLEVMLLEEDIEELWEDVLQKKLDLPLHTVVERDADFLSSLKEFKELSEEFCYKVKEYFYAPYSLPIKALDTWYEKEVKDSEHYFLTDSCKFEGYLSEWDKVMGIFEVFYHRIKEEYNNFMNKRNLTMLTDFYELTMMNGYLKNGMQDKEVVFELFYRKNPDNAGFVIAAGLEQAIDYIENLHFTEADLEYLAKKGMSDEFIDWLRNFKFSGSIKAVPEGTIVYPNEPLVQVKGNVMECQLVETMLLLTINHQSLIATKANRIVRSAYPAMVMEFGARRAQGYDAAELGARAAYIGGVDATATVSADQKYSVPAIGTMAHSWIQLYDSEYDAFKAYALAYPDNCSLLIDTYNVLHSGLPNAIRIQNEVLKPMGKSLKGVRIDSGDLAYLSKKCRKILDDNGLTDCKIIVSNSIDEYLIESLKNQGACIDSYGIGERLITAKSDPVFGGVYKLMSVKDSEGVYQPRIKVSENVEKITNPGVKEVYRLYDEEGYSFCDVLCLEGEIPPVPLKPYNVYKQNKFETYYKVEPYAVRKLLVPIYENGNLVYQKPTIEEIRKYREFELNKVWDEEKRFENPHEHWVDLSEKLAEKKYDLIKEHADGK